MKKNERLSCKLVQDLMPDALGGDLDSNSVSSLRVHVDSCHECAREWQSWVRIQNELKSLGESVDLPQGFFEDLREGVLSQIRSQSEGVAQERQLQEIHGKTIPLSFFAPQRIKPVLLRGSLLAATLLIGFFLGRDFRSQGVGGKAPRKGQAVSMQQPKGFSPSEMKSIENAGGLDPVSTERLKELAQDPQFAARLRVLFQEMESQLASGGGSSLRSASFEDEEIRSGGGPGLGLPASPILTKVGKTDF
jgi:hypothetical protein